MALLAEVDVVLDSLYSVFMLGFTVDLYEFFENLDVFIDL